MQPYNLEYTGIHKSKDSELQLFVYDDLNLTEYEDFKVSDLDKHIDKQKTNWINIHGLNNVDWLKSIGDYFKIDNFMLSALRKCKCMVKTIYKQHPYTILSVFSEKVILTI